MIFIYYILHMKMDHVTHTSYKLYQYITDKNVIDIINQYVNYYKERHTLLLKEVHEQFTQLTNINRNQGFRDEQSSINDIRSCIWYNGLKYNYRQLPYRWQGNDRSIYDLKYKVVGVLPKNY